MNELDSTSGVSDDELTEHFKEANSSNVELLLDEADRAAKETEVRYTHKEIFSRVRNRTGKMQIFKELDKGIDGMEAGRVIEQNEAMLVLENRFKT